VAAKSCRGHTKFERMARARNCNCRARRGEGLSPILGTSPPALRIAGNSTVSRFEGAPCSNSTVAAGPLSFPRSRTRGLLTPMCSLLLPSPAREVGVFAIARVSARGLPVRASERSFYVWIIARDI
jgi:hypothetical protein